MKKKWLHKSKNEFNNKGRPGMGECARKGHMKQTGIHQRQITIAPSRDYSPCRHLPWRLFGEELWLLVSGFHFFCLRYIVSVFSDEFCGVRTRAEVLSVGPALSDFALFGPAQFCGVTI